MCHKANAEAGTIADRAVRPSKRELRDAYAAAVSHGAASTWCDAAEERAYGTLRLLTLGALRLPDLFLYAHVAQAFCEDPEVDRVPLVVVDAVRMIAAGALRLAHRALETRAGEAGYDSGVWVDRALEQASTWLAREGETRRPDAAGPGATGSDRADPCDGRHSP